MLGQGLEVRALGFSDSEVLRLWGLGLDCFVVRILALFFWWALSLLFLGWGFGG